MIKMFKKIDHIGIAVKDLEEAIKIYNLLGLECKGREEVKEQNVKVGIIQIGESRMELLQATTPESVVAKFIDKRGEGVHHIAFQVAAIEKILEESKRRGIQLIDEKPRLGAGGTKIAFMHPKSVKGVLIELVERAESE